MASISSTSSDEAATNANSMSELKDMINDVCQPSTSAKDSSNTDVNANNNLGQALLEKIDDFQTSVEETSTGANGQSSDEERSNPIYDNLNSYGKRLVCAANQSATDVGERVVPPTDEQKPEEEANNSISYGASPPGISTTVTTTPSDSNSKSLKKKPHIMISYNRSSIVTCQRIRKELKKLKYIVWMDIDDMRDNIIEGMARAIEDSYIVLICINHEYNNSDYCKKEAQYASERRIKLIPCFMETPFAPEGWLGFLKGANLHIDFSNPNEFAESFKTLVNEITFIENNLSLWPRQTPPVSPETDLCNANIVIPRSPTTMTTLNSNANLPADLNTIIHDFKKSIILNRHSIKRLNPNEINQLLNQLRQIINSVSTLTEHHDVPEDNELLQLLLTPSRDENQIALRIINGVTNLTQGVFKLIFVIMALWATKYFLLHDD